MATNATADGLPSGSPSHISGTSRFNIWRLLLYFGLMVVDAFAIIIVYTFLRADETGLAIVFTVVTVLANVLIFTPQLYPFRWMTPGLVLVILLVIYPTILTVQTAFTNMGDGHRFTKDQSVQLIEQRGFVPAGAITYGWTPFRRGEEEFGLWLVDEDGNAAFALPGQDIVDVATDDLGFTLGDDTPNIDGYELADASVLGDRETLEYGFPLTSIKIAPLDLDTQYIYDVNAGTVLDQNRGTRYDVTVFTDGTDYALWLRDPRDDEEALLIPSGDDLIEVDLLDREQLRELQIINLDGELVPESVGTFTQRLRTISPEEIEAGLDLSEVRDGVVVGEIEQEHRFVFDPEQGLVLDLNTGADYDTLIYVDESGENIALWMDAGRQGTYLARPGEVILFNGIPVEFEGYTQILTNLERTDALRFLEDIDVDYFGQGDDTVGVINTREAGRPYAQRYVFNEEGDYIEDRATGVKYFADNENGLWVADTPDADELNPGFMVFIGLENFTNILTSPALRGPFVDIFVWTFVFSFLSVVTTFVVGLAMALVVDPRYIRGTKVIRSLLIIPYAIPGVIAILVWRGMLNENIGFVTLTLENIFGVQIPWFSDPWVAKFAVLLVNLWLGYGYMMLISSGALQAIPSDVYEAAAVDGANPWQRFWNITLPLLLVTMGPLLIASFIYNFNNYLIIEALTEGNPPIPGTTTPAGYTDILINYTYNLAFGGGRGAQLGFASAITIVIFFIVTMVTLVQYRFTRRWEEVGENV